MVRYTCVIIWICIIMVRSIQESELGFKTMAVHNQTHITVSCEHSSLKQPMTVRILNMEQNVIAECILHRPSYRCTSGAKALPNGIQQTMEYKSSLKLSCEIGEQLVNIPVTEDADSISSQRPKLKANAVHNKTHVTVSCEHSPYKRSNSKMFIQDRDYLKAECRWDGTQYICTYGAEGLLSGMQFTTEYSSLMKLKCGLDDQLVDVNIVEQTIPAYTSIMITAYNRTFQNMRSGQGSMHTFIMAQVLPLLTFCFLIQALFVSYDSRHDIFH